MKFIISAPLPEDLISIVFSAVFGLFSRKQAKNGMSSWSFKLGEKDHLIFWTSAYFYEPFAIKPTQSPLFLRLGLSLTQMFYEK
ncbi:hypothetical protein GU926_00910 [Nibribacter ruber]|uniref:Uncharacterized protein n=1 Tax=Nibribacter ruber TaxID=2698458 RepID=A0A6P1NST1_9BACT|nr:hypothetical protein [Nibribacter ruber]QHL86080.1 hypothetical protein GU926_00910 [Nibribacter ruber]